MRCDKDGIDTHPDIIIRACANFFYPSTNKRPCKFYKQCQEMIKKSIDNVEWCRRKHEQYTETNSNEKIEYTSPNGYRGILYGKASMIIYNQDGKEILHTSARTPNTLEELKPLVDDMPNFINNFLSFSKDYEGFKP